MMTTENSYRMVEIRDKAEKKVKEPLVIEEHLEDVITKEDEDAIFECRAEGDPQPVCFWYKNGKPITSSQRTKITSNRIWHRLEIRKVKFEDHGIYTVVCRNSVKQISSKATLFVAPKNLNGGVLYTSATGTAGGVVKHLSNVQVNTGDTIELEAEFQCESIDQYTWYKNNLLLTPNERTIVLNSKRTTTLSVIRAEPLDSAVYFVVAKTKQGLVSSLADVQVIDSKKTSENETLPYIEEVLPDEMETNEGEEIRLICKVIFNINTRITWNKNNTPIDSRKFVAENYGNNYIGLRIIDPTRSDTADYMVVMKDEETGKEESTSCYLTVNPSPLKSLQPVELKKPLVSAVACCGSKVSFDCKFALEDPTYFYVVWFIGHYRVERTNSRFGVYCKGGEFVLYIKKLEPGMAGAITCELRKALPNQKSVHINSTSANLALVPISVLQDEIKMSPVIKGKIYNEKVFENCEDVTIAAANGYNDLHLPLNTKLNGKHTNVEANDIILEITYCRLEEEGLFYLHATKGRSEIVSRLLVFEKPKESKDGNGKVIVIEWDDTILPTTFWYAIELAQNNGSYVEAGVASVPSFEIADLTVGRIMKFRVKAVPLLSDVSESNVSIVPTPETVLKPPKNLELKEMELFEKEYFKSGDLIGCGAFGSVVLVRDSEGENYAAKILKTRTQKKRDTAMREFEIMKMLRHPKLVELIDAYVAKDAFILVMDYLWGGELFDRIVEEEHIKEVDVVPYVRQICEALEYLHLHKIAHLDLKPENIICLSPNSGQVKIIDFGLARVLEEGHITRAIYGTRDYVAPEVLNFESLTLACDMWSLGVVTYMLLSGVMPFAGNTWPERSANITMANYNYDETAFREISDLAKDFVDQLLVLPADKRMSAADALNHKWIKEGPPRGAKAGHMKRTRENLKSYLANYRARWQRAGNVMIAAHRLRTHAVGLRCVSAIASAPRIT